MELSAGRAYALQNSFELNGCISAYPESARGYAVGNCYHLDGHCGLLEATSLDLKDVLAVFAERALFWTTTTDMNIYVDKLETLMEDLGVEVVAPTHGLPITDLDLTMPKVREGLIADGDPEMIRNEARRPDERRTG